MATPPEPEKGVFASDNKTVVVDDVPLYLTEDGNDESDEREFGETKDLR